MNREIKFRGRRTDTGEFVYGYYAVASAETWGEDVPLASARICHVIITGMDAEPPSTRYFIDPDTLGEYTGLQDKNGVDIYEGDVIKSTLNSHYWLYEITTTIEQFGNALFAMCFKDNLSTNEEGDNYTYEDRWLSNRTRNYVPRGDRVEVIGNIYENPELLGEDK